MMYSHRFEKRGEWVQETGGHERLVLSWLGWRGIRLYVNGQKYVEWDKEGQRSFLDGIDIVEGKGESFRVGYEGEGPLTVFVTTGARWETFMPEEVQIDVPKLYQYDYVEGHRLCSPTSLCAVMGYYGHSVDVVEFSKRVFDAHAGIYGNWALNVSAANEVMDQPFVVAYLKGFKEVYESLKVGHPVVASVREPLPYPDGHLLVITGFSREGVETMDPAKGMMTYPLAQFEKAWNGLAYIHSVKSFGAGTSVMSAM